MAIKKLLIEVDRRYRQDRPLFRARRIIGRFERS